MDSEVLIANSPVKKMDRKTINLIVGVIATAVVIGIVIYFVKSTKAVESFKKAIIKREYMDEIKFEDEKKEGNMNKLLNEKLDNYKEDEIVGEEADLDIVWKNASKDGFKALSYLDGERASYEKLDSQDSYETQLAESIDYSTSTNNDKFVPSDNGNGNYASYNQEKTDYTVKELMDSDGLLPKEEKDWFDTVPEPVKVNNRHLININRPIGVDTIGSSMKIACRDIRGNIPAPKFVVSPFLNSSVEPDVATVGFCNKNPYN